MPDIAREKATEDKVVEWGFREETPSEHYDFGYDPERQELMQKVGKARGCLQGMSRPEVDVLDEDEAEKLAQGLGIIMEVITGNSEGEL